MKLALASALAVIAAPAFAHSAALPHAHETTGVVAGVAMITIALGLAGLVRLRRG